MMRRALAILLTLAAMTATSSCRKKKAMLPDVPDYGAYSASGGSYRLIVNHQFEMRHASQTPQATTGTLVALHTNRCDYSCSWTLLGYTYNDLTVREKITKYEIRRTHDDPDGEAAFLKKTGRPMPERLRRETLNDWQGFTLDVVYTSAGVVASRQIVDRPKGAAVAAEVQLERSLESPRSREPIHPGGRSRLLTAESSWNAGPELFNPIAVIRWPSEPVAPGYTWQQGVHKDARVLFESLEMRGKDQIAHLSWDWEMSQEQLPEAFAKQVGDQEMKITATGRAVFNATRQRVLDYVSTDTTRHRQDVMRLGNTVDALKLSTTTLSIHWTYDTP